MALDDITDPQAVRNAIEEFRAIGQARFLEKYSFGPSRGWGCSLMVVRSMMPKPFSAQRTGISIRILGLCLRASSTEAHLRP